MLDKERGLKSSRTSFSTRKLARVYVQQGTLGKGIFVYVLNSCDLVKVVKKYCQISHTQEQIKPVKENLTRNLSVVQTRKLTRQETCHEGKRARLYGA